MFPPSKIISLDNKIQAEPSLKFSFIDKKTKNVTFANEDQGNPKHAILLGKIEESSESNNLFNYNAWIDTDFPSIIMVYGRRGTGKSYTLGCIAEGLISNSNDISTSSLSCGFLMIDHLGQFWQMKYPPPSSDVDQHKEIKKWGLKPKGFSNVQVFFPQGGTKHVEDWIPFTIAYSDLDLDDWCGLIGADPYTDTQGQLMSSVLVKVTKDGWGRATLDENGNVTGVDNVAPAVDITIDDIIDCVQNDEEIIDGVRGFNRESRRAMTAKLQSISQWGIFGQTGTTIKEIFKPGVMSVITLVEADQSLKTLITGILVKKIYKARATARTKEELKRVVGKEESSDDIPPGWILIDEAQNYCPRDGHASSRPWLIKYAKEGRSLGLGLVAATQQPSALDSKLTSQVNVLICHGLQLASDVTAVRERILNDMADEIYLDDELIKQTEKLTTVLRNLNRGEALISSSAVNRTFFLQVRPRISAHGGAPSEIK